MSGMESEIAKRQAGFIAAFSSGNAAAAASFYAEDCSFMPHGRETVAGKGGVVGIGGVEAYFKQDMAEGVKSVKMMTEEINGAGDWAFERGKYELDGTRGSETGAYIQVWKKVNGVWCIHDDCFNVVKPAQG